MINSEYHPENLEPIFKVKIQEINEIIIDESKVIQLMYQTKYQESLNEFQSKMQRKFELIQGIFYKKAQALEKKCQENFQNIIDQLEQEEDKPAFMRAQKQISIPLNIDFQIPTFNFKNPELKIEPLKPNYLGTQQSLTFLLEKLCFQFLEAIIEHKLILDLKNKKLVDDFKGSEMEATEIKKSLQELNNIQMKTLSIKQLFNWRKIKLLDTKEIVTLSLSDDQYINNLKQSISNLTEDLEKSKNIQDSVIRKLSKLTQENDKMNFQLCEARNNYSLELLNLREQLKQSILYSEDFEYISVKQLDLTNTFEDSVKQAWDFHKKQIEDHFNILLRKTHMQQEMQRLKILKFERLCEDGNYFVPIKQMTPDFLIGKLVIIEEDPTKIWKSLEKNFGNGYFKLVIEKTMGITSNYKEKLYQDFKQKLFDTNQENITQLKKIEIEFRNQIQFLRDLNEQKQNEIVQLTEEFNAKFQKLAIDIEKEQEMKNQKIYKETIDILKQKVRRLEGLSLDRIIDKIEDIKLENQNIKLNANKYITKYNFSQEIIIQQNGKLNDLASKLINQENDKNRIDIEHRIMQEVQKFKDAYIDFLEKEQTSFAVKIKRLSKNHPALAFFQKDPVQTLEEIRNKVQIQLASQCKQVVNKILGENRREKYCQTEMQGVHRILEIKYNRVGELYVVKETDKCIQVGYEFEDKSTDMPDKTQFTKETQSEYKGQDIQNLNRNIVQFIKDYLSFDHDYKIQIQKDRNKNSHIFYKESIDVLTHLIRVSMQNIQKNPVILKMMIEQRFGQYVQSADRLTTAASKFKKIQNNFNKAIDKQAKRAQTPDESNQDDKELTPLKEDSIHQNSDLISKEVSQIKSKGMSQIRSKQMSQHKMSNNEMSEIENQYEVPTNLNIQLSSKAASPTPQITRNDSSIIFSTFKSRNSQYEIRKCKTFLRRNAGNESKKSLGKFSTINSSKQHKVTCRKYQKPVSIKLKIGSKTSDAFSLKNKISIIDQNDLDQESSSDCSCFNLEQQPYQDQTQVTQISESLQKYVHSEENNYLDLVKLIVNQKKLNSESNNRRMMVKSSGHMAILEKVLNKNYKLNNQSRGTQTTLIDHFNCSQSQLTQLTIKSSSQGKLRMRPRTGMQRNLNINTQFLRPNSRVTIQHEN